MSSIFQSYSSLTTPFSYPEENYLNKYFSQLITYFFGQNPARILYQSFDDFLWIVLGWLQATTFIASHSSLHYLGNNSSTSWYGTQFSPVFAHRSNFFWYNSSVAGWDTTFCGGGMVWNNDYQKQSQSNGPYKNTITNTLYITASANMYLDFLGDTDPNPAFPYGDNIPTASAHDPKWLNAAIQGYQWLSTHNFTNSQGLYVDGYHVSNWDGTGRTCDLRTEDVWTYNQGVLLGGLRSLWEATGNTAYLNDGYTLIQAVISATSSTNTSGTVLGTGGILAEVCEASGSCNSDQQSFKGIFFRYLAEFCEPLPSTPRLSVSFEADSRLCRTHEANCKRYAQFVEANAKAALATVDGSGQYGLVWTAGANGTSNVRSFMVQTSVVGLLAAYVKMAKNYL